MIPLVKRSVMYMRCTCLVTSISSFATSRHRAFGFLRPCKHSKRQRRRTVVDCQILDQPLQSEGAWGLLDQAASQEGSTVPHSATDHGFARRCDHGSSVIIGVCALSLQRRCGQSAALIEPLTLQEPQSRVPPNLTLQHVRHSSSDRGSAAPEVAGSMFGFEDTELFTCCVCRQGFATEQPAPGAPDLRPVSLPCGHAICARCGVEVRDLAALL